MLRAHRFPNARCVIDDLDQIARGQVQTLCLCDANRFMRGNLLERWAVLHGMSVNYGPLRPHLLEAYAHKVEKEVVNKMQPGSLDELNIALSAYRSQSANEKLPAQRIGFSNQGF
jgi:hypothetical protein